MRTVRVNELLITRGTQSPLDDEHAFAPAELKVALDEHKAYLESLKERPAKRAVPAPAISGQEPVDLGF